MREGRPKTSSIRGPVILFTVILVLIVTLTVLWNLVLVHDYRAFRDLALHTESLHWTLIAVGSTLFVVIIVLSSVLGAQLISRTRWNQRQSDFLASVTHELNSPLSSVKLFAQTLRERDLADADRARFVDRILADVDRLHRLIANILRAAEIGSHDHELPVIPQHTDLHAYLTAYVEDARVLHAGEIDLSLDAPRNIQAAIDPVMFRQVLDNLVDNAIRYRSEKPARLALRLRRTGDTVELRAVDAGIGIPPDHLRDVFRRFYRVDRHGSSRRRTGTGIGLFVVQSIVGGHGGRVGAESEGEGRGTTVWIRLPAPDSTGAAP